MTIRDTVYSFATENYTMFDRGCAGMCQGSRGEVCAWGKKVTGDALNNPVLKTEGKVTLVDALLAGAVLAGLVLNALFALWWADPLAGLVIVYYGFKEGWHALHV
jgi:hypothetical protein